MAQQNLQTNGNLLATYLKDLSSNGNILNTYQKNLRTKANIVVRQSKGLESKANIEVYVIKPWTIFEKADQRMESLANPVAKWRVRLPIPATWENRYFEIPINAILRQIVLIVPSLRGATCKFQMLSEDRVILYEKTNIAEDQKILLFTSGEQIPIAELCTMNIALSAVQNTETTFEVVIYGI